MKKINKCNKINAIGNKKMQNANSAVTASLKLEGSYNLSSVTSSCYISL